MKTYGQCCTMTNELDSSVRDNFARKRYRPRMEKPNKQQ